MLRRLAGFDHALRRPADLNCTLLRRLASFDHASLRRLVGLPALELMTYPIRDESCPGMDINSAAPAIFAHLICRSCQPLGGVGEQ